MLERVDCQEGDDSKKEQLGNGRRGDSNEGRKFCDHEKMTTFPLLVYKKLCINQNVSSITYVTHLFIFPVS